MTDNKCVIYTRVSSIEQYIENYSIETQVAFCLRKAEELGYVENQIQSRGGVAESSKDIDVRKIYKEMVNYVCDPRNKVKTLIVYSTDRFSRHLESAVTDIARMTKKGVILYTVVENYNTSTFEGIADINAKINEAQRFIGRLSQRTKAGIQHGIESGRYPFAKAPRGYSKNKEIKNIVINEEGYLIREAFKMLLQGYTMSQIQEKMKRSNLDINLKRWGEIFRNPVYAGVIICKENNKEYKGKFETIISELEFKQVQEILSNKSKPRIKHTEGLELLPLKSLVKCTCGHTMTGYVHWNKTNTPAYYICTNENCRENVAAKTTNENYFNLLKNIELNNEFKSALLEQFQNLFHDLYNVELIKETNIKQGISLKEQQLDKLVDMMLAGALDTIIYEKKKAQYQKELSDLQSSLNSINLDIPDISEFVESCFNDLTDLSALWNQLSYSDQQMLYKLLFKEKPVLKKDENVIDNIVLNEIFTNNYELKPSSNL